jgi:hypothetical protein
VIVVNGKQLLIATMFASVLLTLVFIPASTRSEPSTQALAPYDAWYDVNGDGKIDIKDFAAMAQTYGTSGDPTRNVTVTNWQANQNITITRHATKLIMAADALIINPGDSWISPWVWVDGYSKVSINVHIGINLNAYYLNSKGTSGDSFIVDSVTNFNGFLAKTYDVMNQYIRVWIYNYGGAAVTFTVEIYLMA